MALDKFGPNSIADDAITNNKIADDAVTVDKVSDQVVGRRNLVINGAMNVAQRGTSHTYSNTQSGVHSLDRYFSAVFVSGGSFTLSQQSVSLSDNIGAEYFMRAVPSGTVAAGSATVYTEHKIEDIKRFHNRSVTVSFDVKASSSLTFQLRNRKNYGFGGSSDEYSSFSDVSATTTWTKHTVTFAAEDLSSKTIGVANSFYSIMFYWSTDQGNGHLNDASIDITNLQIEFGIEATPFEHRSYAEELTLCQRYCNVIDPQVAYKSYGFVGFCESSTRVKTMYTFPTTMRTTPSFSRTGNWMYDGATTNPTFVSLNNTSNSTTMCRLEDNVTGGSTGEGVILLNLNDTTAKITFDAEL